MEKILDLHIHSKYSRACSKDLELPKIAAACEIKGIDIVSTGDFTHPLWLKHIAELLEEENHTGLFRLKSGESLTRFMLGTEVACIYKHHDKVRRLHLLLFAPSLEVVSRLNQELVKRGINLSSDGRPIMGMSGKDLTQLCAEIDDRLLVVPAHAWTPWFSVFGSKSGYDSLEECFEEFTPKIFAIETGLSSDPPMNRRLSQLDQITLVSNSDAHSLQKLGREANVFSFENEGEISYHKIWQIIKAGDQERFLYTIEFYPEEGMYHFDGHRSCGISLEPSATRRQKGVCPKCKKKLVVGVLNRVEELADRDSQTLPKNFVPHRYIVPLREIIAGSLEVGAGSKKVEREYQNLLKAVGSEFHILLHAPLPTIAAAGNEDIALGIQNMRSGQVKIVPGYDGVYGTVDLFPKQKIKKYQQIQLV